MQTHVLQLGTIAWLMQFMVSRAAAVDAAAAAAAAATAAAAAAAAAVSGS